MKKLLLTLVCFFAYTSQVFASPTTIVSGSAFIGLSNGDGLNQVYASNGNSLNFPHNGTYEFIIDEDHSHPRSISATISNQTGSKQCTIAETSPQNTFLLNYYISKVKIFSGSKGHNMYLSIYNGTCSFMFFGYAN